jgi:hypothetical protein
MAIDENDPIMKHHFANAGIDDASPTEESGDNTDAPSSNDTSPQSGEDSSTPQGQDSVGGEQGADTVSSDSSGNDRTKKQGKEEKGKVTGNPGDLRDGSGNVIARAGPERRFYEQLQTSRQQIQALERREQAAIQRSTSLEQQLQVAQTSIQAFGAQDAVSASNALRLYQDLKTNPVNAITNLIAELKAAGHNIDGIGSAVDTAAIQRMIAANSGNSGQQRQGPSQQEIDQQAEQEVATFFATYPDAVTHDEILADIVTKNPNLSIETAYFQLKNAAIERGLDFSRPLQPQIQAQVAARGGQQNQQQGQRTPMLNGRGGANNLQVEKDDKFDLTPGGETYDDIIRDELRKANLARQ